MAPVPRTGSKARSIAMQRTHVGYGGCWKCLHAWQRCSASTPRFAASQNGLVHSLGTGIGLVTLVQSLIVEAFGTWAYFSASSLSSIFPMLLDSTNTSRR